MRRIFSTGSRCAIRAPGVLVTCALLLAMLSLPASVTRALQVGTAGPAETVLVFTQIPYRPESHDSGSAGFLSNRAAGKGSRICALRPAGATTVLTPEFAAASDPSVSFDGRQIVFAGKKSPQDSWNIWEMDADGRNKRQLTRSLGNCREPEYLARSSITPPDFADRVRWITFVSDGSGSYADGSAEPATSLYATNTEPLQGRGSVVWRTTFNLASDFSPTVLRDGRLLFSSAQRASRVSGSGVRYPLLASNWDGSGLNLFCSDDQGAAVKTMAVETADRHLVFVEAGSVTEAGGRLARVSFRRPLRTHEVLSKGSGYYLYPRPLPDGQLLVSYAGGRESYGVYTFDSGKGGPGAKLVDDPQWEDLDVQPIVTRPEPQGLISSVVDRLAWGDLHCISVYESDRPEAAGIRKGDVKRVRFITATPAKPKEAARPVKGKHDVLTRVLGEAPVEPDGSFFVRLPGDTPFYVETLDAQGRVLQTMARWIWVRRGTSRGCIGCHENKELAPENVTTEAIKRGRPHDLMNYRASPAH